MSAFLRLSGIALVVVSLCLGSVGYSLWIHTCGHSQTTDYELFPEFFSAEDACCGPSLTASVGNACGGKASESEGLSKSSCCKNQRLLFMISSFVNHPPLKTIIALSTSFPASYKSIILPGGENQTAIRCLLTEFYPPPEPTGQERVILFRQIRVYA